MKVIPATISDIKIIQPNVILDKRGFFLETFKENWFKNNILNISFVQENHSKSVKGVLRGLHYQIKQPQGKLVRVIHGKIYDVAVDLRKSSKTFGSSFGIILSESNKTQLWIPPGFAHGFYVLSEYAELIYKTTDYYAPRYERTILWNDRTLDIDWHIPTEIEPIVSGKDNMGLAFKDAEYYE